MTEKKIQKSILLIEDHELPRQALTRILEEKDYKVTAVATIEEARSALNTGTFTVVMVDGEVPKRTNTSPFAIAPVELAKELGEAFDKGSRIVLISGGGGMNQSTEALQAVGIPHDVAGKPNTSKFIYDQL